MIYKRKKSFKSCAINGGDYGEDEDGFIKLTKHKVMELEMDTYSVIV